MQNYFFILFTSFLVVIAHPDGCKKDHPADGHTHEKPPAEIILSNTFVRGTLLGYDDQSEFGGLAIYFPKDSDNSNSKYQNEVMEPHSIAFINDKIGTFDRNKLFYFKVKKVYGQPMAFDITQEKPNNNLMNNSIFKTSVNYNKFYGIGQGHAHYKMHLSGSNWSSQGNEGELISITNPNSPPFIFDTITINNKAMYDKAISYLSSGPLDVFKYFENGASGGKLIDIDVCHWHENKLIECQNN